ncbi:hypothetical protein SAMN04488072_102227 [Lentibacillus halodurans]|uniref:Uncharacterized protein n=1 Tax=Lentibacillus halodurans TaxID=237679 RepID=A0A1I0W5A5_9BACI|nr:hypothetical protein [Lentibacillus halodurans]SFA83862.1 hypothetical protein SAMN04488072_102227 [Lentibacillus halodurans]
MVLTKPTYVNAADYTAPMKVGEAPDDYEDKGKPHKVIEQICRNEYRLKNAWI